MSGNSSSRSGDSFRKPVSVLPPPVTSSRVPSSSVDTSSSSSSPSTPLALAETTEHTAVVGDGVKLDTGLDAVEDRV
jgi:hypothetical protein